jgi:hypothetical protein
MPLEQKDYPRVKYWLATSWTDSKAEKDVFTTGPKPEKKKHGTFWFLEDASGAPLSDERCTAVTKRARQIFAQLNASGAGAAKWGEIGNVGQDYYRNQMYSFFPDLRLCELDWKVNRLATETYSSWYRKRKGKLAVPVKQEDANAKDAENLVNGANHSAISLSATPQPPKRPAPPSLPLVESTSRAKKVKSGYGAPKPRPAWAARASPPKTHRQPILDPFSDVNVTDTSVTADLDAMTAAPLSSEPLDSSLATPAPLPPSPISLSTNPVVPTCSTSACIQTFDSDSPGSRLTTPLPQSTTAHESVSPRVDTVTNLCPPPVNLDGPDDDHAMAGMVAGDEMTVSDAESPKAPPVSLVIITQFTC